MEDMTISILGTEYAVFFRTEEQDPKLEGLDGYCDWTAHEIVVKRYEKPGKMDVLDIPRAIRATIRHEIIHAFAYESGLAECSEWAQNEEMVDWIARQFGKMHEAFEDAGAMD